MGLFNEVAGGSLRVTENNFFAYTVSCVRSGAGARYFIFICTLLFLSACGIKGDLVRPKDIPAGQPAQEKEQTP